MKAIRISPEDIGAASEWSESWVKFITKFGFAGGTPWNFIYLCEIEID